jgi:hypothetical protein
MIPAVKFRALFGIGVPAAFAAGALSLALKPSPYQRKCDVILFLSTDCPVAQRQSPSIAALVREFESKGVEFRAVFPNDLETNRGVREFLKERGIGIPFELDLGGVRARREGIGTLPAAVVLDAKGVKTYQGAILESKDPSLPHREFLKEAIQRVLDGKSKGLWKTEPFGCLLMPGQAPPEASKVNYAEHIAPILNARCVECHRPGEVAPFSLLGYENARKWAPMLARRVSERKMPPWKAVPGYGEFKDANVLSELEIETIERWAESGAARGDPKKEPKAPEFDSEWALGTPDLILQPKEPYPLAAEGPDEYRHFVLKTDFKETRYVTAMAVKPGNPQVVHHVIAFLDERGQSHKLDGKDGKEGYASFGGVGFLPDGSFGGWAPGLRPQRTPENAAFELKPGATIVMQVHYHRNGKPTLYFAKKEPEKVMALAWLANVWFRIPAGAKSHRVTFDYPIPADVTVYSVMPHMHLLGKSMRADVVYSNGSTKPLILVEDWDFNWQLNYMFKQPVRIPAGSKVRIEAVYDNSESNPNNPSKPPRDVVWGDETTDEMFLLVASYTLDGGRAPKVRRVGFGGG